MERDRFIGSMIGCAIGDAIGEMAFLYRKREILVSKIGETDLLRYTDDTAMAIGIAKALIEKGDIDQKSLGDFLSEEFYKEPWRGYGPGPPTVFEMVRKKGISYVDAAKMLYSGEGSFGNGAAMRIAPVGLFFHSLPREEFYKKAEISASVTHAHPVGIDGAVVQARAIAVCLGLDPDKGFSYKDFLDELIAISKTDIIREKLLTVRELLDRGKGPKDAIRMIGKSVAVHESMPFSIYSFLRHPDSFEDCLFCAVLNGGDRDTLGAMACSISGAYLGYERIPPDWIEKIENRDLIEELSKRLYEIHPCNSRF